MLRRKEMQLLCWPLSNPVNHTDSKSELRENWDLRTQKAKYFPFPFLLSSWVVDVMEKFWVQIQPLHLPAWGACLMMGRTGGKGKPGHFTQALHRLSFQRWSPYLWVGVTGGLWRLESSGCGAITVGPQNAVKGLETSNETLIQGLGGLGPKFELFVLLPLQQEGSQVR